VILNNRSCDGNDTDGIVSLSPFGLAWFGLLGFGVDGMAWQGLRYPTVAFCAEQVFITLQYTWLYVYTVVPSSASQAFTVSDITTAMREHKRLV